MISIGLNMQNHIQSFESSQCFMIGQKNPFHQGMDQCYFGRKQIPHVSMFPHLDLETCLCQLHILTNEEQTCSLPVFYPNKQQGFERLASILCLTGKFDSLFILHSAWSCIEINCDSYANASAALWHSFLFLSFHLFFFFQSKEK